MASSSSSPWPPPARRLPLANRSNLSSASPSPSPAPRSSKIRPPPSALANKENAHPLLLPPSSPSDSSAPLKTPTPLAASLASSLWHDPATFRDVVRPSSHLQAHRDRDAAAFVEDQKRASRVDPLLQADGTPARPANAVDVESFVSTPQRMSTEDPLSNNGRLQLYRRRKPTGTANLTMSCPPLDRSRTIRDLGDRVKHWPLKRGYDFPCVEEARTSQGTSKKSKNRSRRRSLPESPSKDWLPETFVAVQRSYFAEVDAFELSEEEAGSEEE